MLERPRQRPEEEPVIFDEHRAIHLHIGKTAGVAVEQLLRPGPRDANVADHDSLFGYDPERQIYLQHASAAVVRELVGSRFDSFFTFAVVRNPFTRLFSAYYYLGPLHDELFGSFEDFVLGLPSYLEVGHRDQGSHFLPQVSYTHIDTQPVCDEVVYFEHLPASLDPVRNRLQITGELTVQNRIRGPHRPTNPPNEHYTAAMVNVVHEVYRRDFDLLNYDLDPANPEPVGSKIPASSIRADRTGMGPGQQVGLSQDAVSSSPVRSPTESTRWSAPTSSSGVPAP